MTDQLSVARQLAVAYADEWATGRNPDYGGFEPDCTDFVSQTLRAGGFAENDMWSHSSGLDARHLGFTTNGPAWDPFSDNFRWGRAAPATWAVAPDLHNYLLSQEGTASGAPTGTQLFDKTVNPVSGSVDPLALTNAGLQPGDVVFYDWGDVESDGRPSGIEHSAIFTGQHEVVLPDGTKILADTVDYHSNDKRWQMWALPKTDKAGNRVDRPITYYGVHVHYAGEPGGPATMPDPKTTILAPGQGAGPQTQTAALRVAAPVGLQPLSLRGRSRIPAFSDGGEVTEGGPEDGGGGMVSMQPTGRLMPALGWSTWASDAGQAWGKATFVPQYADGGDVEEHGPQDDDGSLVSKSKTGRFMPFLQWDKWFDIAEQTGQQLAAAGVTTLGGAVDAITGAVSDAATAGVAGVADTVGHLGDQFTTAVQSAVPPSGTTPAPTSVSAGSPSSTSGRTHIDRSMTINVQRAMDDLGIRDKRLQQQIGTYLSSVA